MTTTEDRTAWLTDRRNGIGASDVAAILGLSPWGSPYSVWADKVGLTPLDANTGSEAMEFGLMAEPMLKAYFERRTGLSVHGEQTWCSHPERPWMRCSVDGFVFESHSGSDIENALGVYEAKTTSEPPWDEVPVHYQCQATWSMAVTSMPRVWFGVLHLAFGRPQFRVYKFERDDTEAALVVGKVARFWTEHVLTGVAPEPDAHPATTEAMRWWEPETDKTIEADERMVRLVNELKHARNVMKDAETAVEVRANLLKDLMRDAEVLTHGTTDKGKPKVLATWKTGTRKQFDKTTALAEYPELAEPPFTVELPTRTFLPK